MKELDIKKIKAKAKEQIKNNWQDLFIGYILFTIVVGALSSFGIGFILIGPITVGFVSYMIKFNRKETYKIDNLIDGFKNNFENSLVAGILQTVFVFLWSLLFIIPGIIKGISYSMTYFIIYDNPNLQGKDALAKSEELMRGHKMEYFKLILSFIGWIILSAFTFGILYILYVGPYIEAARVQFYEELKTFDVSRKQNNTILDDQFKIDDSEF